MSEKTASPVSSIQTTPQNRFTGYTCRCGAHWGGLATGHCSGCHHTFGDVWRITQETAANSHPAPFPIGLPSRAIETTAPSLVLDLFAGSGTTLRAACNAGVRSIGIEKSERYCELIAKRLGQYAIDFREGA